MTRSRIQINIYGGSVTIGDEKIKHRLMNRTENATQRPKCWKQVGYLDNYTIWSWGMYDWAPSALEEDDMKHYEIKRVVLRLER